MRANVVAAVAVVAVVDDVVAAAVAFNVGNFYKNHPVYNLQYLSNAGYHDTPHYFVGASFISCMAS
jgi:hypothetical protein